VDQDFIDTGVIAQEIQKILPDAVKQQKGRILVNGEFIEDFLLINKDRIFMENIGAIKELCKLTGSLETRIQQLERINTRLSQRKETTMNNGSTFKKIDMMTFDRNHITQKPPKYRESFDYCSNKMIQAVIIFLILIILASLSCLSTLYFVEHRGQQQPLFYMAGIRSGSDANSIDIQKEYIPKINGKYYTFAPHNSQAINSNHKSTTHDNLCNAHLISPT
jgi:myelin regulatory factor